MIDAAQMMRSFNTQALESMRQALSASETAPAAETGRAMGMEMEVVKDPTADLLDSMEELAMSFEDKKATDIATRKFGEMRNVRTDLVKALQNWMKVVPDIPGAAFMERLLQNVRTLAAHGGTADGLLTLMQEGSGDPTVELAMLEVLAQAEGLDAESKKLLEDAKALLLTTKGPDARAGLNLAEEINARAAATGETVQGLRDLYRSEVLGFSSPQDCFRSLMLKAGGNAGGIAAQLEFLLKGCGIDLQSASPSKSMAELTRILGDLQCVNVLTTVMEKADVLAGKMLSQFGEQAQLSGAQLMERMLALTEKSFVMSSNVAELVGAMGMRKLLAQVYFTTGMIDLFRQFSPRLFTDESGRQRLVDAAQEHLDGLVDRQAEEDARGQT